MNNKPVVLLAATPFGSVRVWFKPNISCEDKKSLAFCSLWKGIDAKDPACKTEGVEVSPEVAQNLPSMLPNLHFTSDATEAMAAWGVSL